MSLTLEDWEDEISIIGDSGNIGDLMGHMGL